MAREEKIIYVFDDFSCDEPVLLGRLYVGAIKQRMDGYYRLYMM